MTTATFTTVFEQSAEELWGVIRDFGNYALWADGAGSDTMEEGRTSDSVGGARVIDLPGRRIVQRLTAFSDADRSYRYTFEAGSPEEIENYEATLSVTPITADNRSFVQWTATFECAPDRREHWQEFYAKSFEAWLQHLRERL